MHAGKTHTPPPSSQRARDSLQLSDQVLHADAREDNRSKTGRTIASIRSARAAQARNARSAMKNLHVAVAAKRAAQRTFRRPRVWLILGCPYLRTGVHVSALAPTAQNAPLPGSRKPGLDVLADHSMYMLTDYLDVAIAPRKSQLLPHHSNSPSDPGGSGCPRDSRHLRKCSCPRTERWLRLSTGALFQFAERINSLA